MKAKKLLKIFLFLAIIFLSNVATFKITCHMILQSFSAQVHAINFKPVNMENSSDELLQAKVGRMGAGIVLENTLLEGDNCKDCILAETFLSREREWEYVKTVDVSSIAGFRATLFCFQAVEAKPILATNK